MLLDGSMRTALVKMITVLQSEESLLDINNMAVASGTMESKYRKKHIKRLERGTNNAARRKRMWPKNPLDLARQMLGTGIPVIFEEKLPDGTIREVDLGSLDTTVESVSGGETHG